MTSTVTSHPPRTQQRVHLLGIGGTGMSSLALHLQSEGYLVSGSDLRESRQTGLLKEAGIHVRTGERLDLPRWVERLVVSSAIPEDNAELQEARQRGLPVTHRSTELSRLFNQAQGIAIAGSHGKTTTSALLTHILASCGESPRAMIGGNPHGYQSNAFLGHGPHFVAEADESDGSLTAYRAVHAVVTSVDDDVNVTAHEYSDCGYDRDKVQGVVDTLFRKFAENVERSLWVCHEHARACALLSDISTFKTYGTDGSCTLRAEILWREALATTCQVFLRGRLLGKLTVRVPGHHNVMNSLAAIGVALDLGLPYQDIAHAVAMFRGVGRRFEEVGAKSGALCVDDYAHNPQKVSAALQAAHQANRGRIIALFQPHRFTRMKLLGPGFLPALDGADQIILTDVYSGGEAPNGFSIEDFRRQLVKRAPAHSVHWAADREAVRRKLDEIVRPGDLVISLGAGSCGQWLRDWVHDTPPAAVS